VRLLGFVGPYAQKRPAVPAVVEGSARQRRRVGTDELAPGSSLRQAGEERAAAHRASLREARARMLAGVEDDLDELTAASNAAVDLIHAGKLDEARRARSPRTLSGRA
jgi:hypothetical protein